MSRGDVESLIDGPRYGPPRYPTNIIPSSVAAAISALAIATMNETGQPLERVRIRSSVPMRVELSTPAGVVEAHLVPKGYP